MRYALLSFLPLGDFVVVFVIVAAVCFFFVLACYCFRIHLTYPQLLCLGPPAAVLRELQKAPGAGLVCGKILRAVRRPSAN